ncbi:hypothetical protein AQS8620_01442 [Aquimixticola soesokkakensis]|uniref:Uncharacterized protein n=1 Tax=Aquimixticola soesokkakensis TaxID=1519096 RepID=A0A1Y5SDQ3_9RHOB|nr:hypothetical protein [Aquimixticola soesokkakensis]SLN38349.1 hypothetical protein AQS8620_01442 [Aquimixticola soesokkakensis]
MSSQKVIEMEYRIKRTGAGDYQLTRIVPQVVGTFPDKDTAEKVMWLMVKDVPSVPANDVSSEALASSHAMVIRDRPHPFDVAKSAISDVQDMCACRLCGRKFTVSVEAHDLCARCARG